ncbi:MAG TPA: aldo/keto reductase [Chloroflexota bacterium]|nr:aldo/keto reductase [Chloroflexota bacterium]
MEYRTLGRTGVKVSPLCLGTMMFGQRGNPDHEDSVRIIHRALDAGINFVDTANVYSDGESEEIVGKALRGRRDEVILATKVHGVRGPGPNDRGNSRVHILREVENSLRRLQTDYIDLYQIHRPDPDTSIEETLRALDQLVRDGKVRYIGSSTFAAWELVESYWVSDRYNLVRFECEQPPYSIFVRAIEKDVLPVCVKYGTGVIPWSPLNRGWLAGKYRRNQPVDPQSRAGRSDPFIDSPESESGRRKLELVEQLIPMAEEIGVNLAQYALAWTLMNPAITAPIIGPRIMSQLEDNLKAVEVRIPEEHLRRIDELVPPGTDV